MEFNVNHPLLFVLAGLTLGKITDLTAQQYVNISLVMTISIMVPVSVVFTIAVARILYKRGVL